MSIRFHDGVPSKARTVNEERERCLRILRGLPLGYRTDDEHQALEKFVKRASLVIASGMEVTESID